jgi:hypothetical protein
MDRQLRLYGLRLRAFQPLSSQITHNHGYHLKQNDPRNFLLSEEGVDTALLVGILG